MSLISTPPPHVYQTFKHVYIHIYTCTLVYMIYACNTCQVCELYRYNTNRNIETDLCRSLVPDFHTWIYHEYARGYHIHSCIWYICNIYRIHVYCVYICRLSGIFMFLISAQPHSYQTLSNAVYTASIHTRRPLWPAYTYIHSPLMTSPLCACLCIYTQHILCIYTQSLWLPSYAEKCPLPCLYTYHTALSSEMMPMMMMDGWSLII